MPWSIFGRLVALSLLLGCSNDARSSGLTDSTSEGIVSWRLSSQPTVVIGDQSDAASELARVTIARRSGQRIYVANGLPPQIRIFDRAGTHLRSLGSPGDGPGEFRAIFGIWISGDTIVASDPGTGRVTRFHSSGELLDSHVYQAAIRAAGSVPSVIVGRFEDGSFMARPNVVWPTLADGQGLVRPRYALLRVSPDASSVDTIGTFRASAYLVSGARQGVPNFWSIPFSSRSYTVAHGAYAYVSDSETLSATQLGLDGEPVQHFAREDFPATQVTQAEWDEVRESRIDGVTQSYRERGESEDVLEEEIRTIRRQFREMPRPESFPAHSSLRVDALGNVWLRHHAATPGELRTWSVFSEDGSFIATAETPTQLWITEIGADYVIGVWTGELDVQTVREFALLKPGAPAS